MRHNNVDPMHVHKSIMHQIRLISPSTTNDTFPSSDFGHMLSVGSIYFDDRFCARKKWDSGWWVGIVMICRDMVAVLAGCIRALVSTGTKWAQKTFLS